MLRVTRMLGAHDSNNMSFTHPVRALGSFGWRSKTIVTCPSFLDWTFLACGGLFVAFFWSLCQTARQPCGVL